MADRIVVGEGHCGPHRRHQHEGVELQVLLGHPIGPFEPDRRGPGACLRVIGDHRVADGLSFDVMHDDLQISRTGARRRQRCKHRQDQHPHGPDPSR